MKLREIAHSRTGDKGNTANISVIAPPTSGFGNSAQAILATRNIILARLLPIAPELKFLI